LEFRRSAVELARLREKPIGQIAKDLGIAESCCTGTAAAIANAVHHASASATCRSHSTSCYETPPAARQADRLWGTWQDVHQASTLMCGTPDCLRGPADPATEMIARFD
jgi:hypothetical protein